MGEGRILNELASCKNSGEGGISEVYNALEEVSGLGQGSTNFRHSERSEESQLTSLRRGFCKIFSLPSILRNLNITLSLGEGTKSYPLYLWERAEFQCEFLRALEIRVRGATHVAQPINIGDNFVNSGEGVMLVIKVYKGINERIKIMKKIIENLMKHTRHAELDSASQVNPLLSLRDTLPQGRENTLCAKHIVKNLSTYRLNVLKTDKTPTLSRICKFAFSSLTNSTLSQRERVKYGFTLAEVFSPCRKVKLNFGFTLAEVLITLGIIGVVAALVIPGVINNFKSLELKTRFKKADSIIQQAMKMTFMEVGIEQYKDIQSFHSNDMETMEHRYAHINEIWSAQFKNAKKMKWEGNNWTENQQHAGCKDFFGNPAGSLYTSCGGHKSDL